MKFLVAITALVSLAMAAPASPEADLTAVPAEESAPLKLAARQAGCNGRPHGSYWCYHNLSSVDPSLSYPYLGQCVNGNVIVSTFSSGVRSSHDKD